MVINKHVFLSGQEGKTTNSQRDLPKMLEQIRDDAIIKLDSLLKEMLNHADDALFDLADKASSNTNQSLYFDAMRELRIKRKGIEKLFSQELKNNFFNLQYSEKSTESSNLETININSLSLVHEDELEENLAFDSMIGKANLQYEVELSQIVTRLDTIFANHRIDKLNNPLNPESICASFRAASQSLELDIKTKLVVYKLLDRQIISKLDKLYEGINSFLINKGILPDLSGYGLTKKKPTNSDTTIASSVKQNTTDAVADTGVNVFDALKSLLSTQRSATETNNTVTNNSGVVPVVDSLQLIKALSTIQVDSEQLPITDNAYFPVSDLRNQLETALPISGPISSHTIGQVNDDIIDVISMLFDFILDDKNLPSEFKILLGRLQIPILKVAVIDETFFSKGNHPARKLLNEMAHAAVGWTEDIEGGVFSLKEKVEQIVTKIINEFDDDVSLFKESLDEFHLFIETHKNRASLLERRLREAEEGKAKAETAKTCAKDALVKIVGNHQLPEVIHQIIFDAWQSVMLLIYLRNGDESVHWHNNLQIAEGLINSLIVPKTMQLKMKLKSDIIILLESLKSGLDYVGYSEFKSQHFFLELEKMHNKVLNSENVLLPIVPVNELITETDTSSQLDDTTVPNDDDFSTELSDVLIINESDTEQINIQQDDSFDLSLTDSGSLHEDDEIMILVESIQAGSWFQLKVQGKPKRVKLAAIISSIGKYIFVNNTGKKIAEYSKLELILEFRRDNIIQLDDGALFDRALKSIVTNFRSQKQYLDTSF